MASALKNLSEYDETNLPSAKKMKFGIVVADWNAKITHALYEGCFDTLIKHEAEEENIKTVQVPGTFELTAGAKILLQNQKYDAIICIGCVIKGETPHFDLICSSTFNAILSLSINFNKPICNGIITALNLNQAHQRSKNKLSSNKPNKGSEAAKALISIFKNGTKKI